jgi:hypothetical protein
MNQSNLLSINLCLFCHSSNLLTENDGKICNTCKSIMKKDDNGNYILIKRPKIFNIIQTTFYLLAATSLVGTVFTYGYLKSLLYSIMLISATTILIVNLIEGIKYGVIRKINRNSYLYFKDTPKRFITIQTLHIVIIPITIIFTIIMVKDLIFTIK